MKQIFGIFCGIYLLGGMGVSETQAQEEKTLGWFLTAEVSGLWTAGNSRTTSMGVAAELTKKMERSKLQFLAGTAQTYTQSAGRIAIGTEDDYSLKEDSSREKTAELTAAQARYDHDLSKRFFAFGGVDLLRNPFAGIESRFLFFAGAGNIWADSDHTKFRTDYAFTYTVEDEVVANPIVDTNFPGLRVGAEFHHKISETSDFDSSVSVDFNLKDSDDIRGEWKSALPVTISKTFFLAPSLRLMWRNQPALGDVTLLNTDNVKIGTVAIPLEKLDTIASVSLVAKF